MIRFDIKNKFNMLLLTLFAIVFVVWSLFYSFISYYILTNTENQLQTVSEQIINSFSTEFTQLEKLSYILAHNVTIEEFVAETDMRKYFLLSGNIEKLLSESNYNPDFVKNIIIFNYAGNYRRFAGKLANSSCARIINLINISDLPKHFVVRLENRNFICYASSIDTDSQRIGVLVMLIDEATILDMSNSYDSTDSLFIAVADNNEIIVSNSKKSPKSFSQPNEFETPYVVRKHVGLTPFEIIVAADEDYVNASRLYFSIAAAITAVAFGVVLLIFARQLNKRFFKPMRSIMSNIETIDVDIAQNTLPQISSEEFDKLVSKINEMLIRLDQKNKDIQNTQLLLKNAEIDKQKAIIFSLKKQINAHFTINTINTIKILIEQEDLLKAQKISDGLSELIRYAYNKEEFVNVWEEFQTLESYVMIMNIRYDNNLEVFFDLDDRLMDYQMPRMLLQPIVENSIIHGFKDKHSDCRIYITALYDNGSIIITIKDNGHGMSKHSLNKLNAGLEDPADVKGIENIALLNIKKRLVSYYGSECSLHIKSQNGIEVMLSMRAEAPINS